ncbi:OmpA family protein [[Limnothrix rosea] IAM M-220]|uniref:OmpA family protein n=1 Tax=[Limnothrix rosea] IAM M-220 TaxID=454133 RepID=UPI00095DDD6C|nr:BON domain-containing protein [[Limnothrix rosea] IAM M-220]OKH17510.1 hypothetical protein NIES208_09225 [[Limnothrix rosea] IAM M-220]
MPDQNQQQDNGDRLDNMDILRSALMGEQANNYDEKISDLENQINWIREEMRTQGNEVQNTLDQKINEVLQAIQVSHFHSETQTPSAPAPTPQKQPPANYTSAPPQPPQPPSPATPAPTARPKQTSSPEPSIPSPSISPEADLDFFSEQISSILGSNVTLEDSIETTASPVPDPPATPPIIPQPTYGQNASVPPQSTVKQPIAPPSTASSQPPSTYNVPQPAYNPPSPNPTPQSPRLERNFNIVAEDEATQINNLRSVLRDEDVMRLRQVNNQLDYKLRQVEEYLAASQQPLKDLLPLMTELVQLKIQEAKTPEAPKHLPPKQRNRLSWGTIFAFLVLLLLIPLGFYGYWLRRAFLLEQDVAIALATNPDLAIYRLKPDLRNNTLYLTGKLPTQTLSDQAEAIAQNTLPAFEISNNILVVEKPLTPEQRQAEIDKIIEPLNNVNGIQVTTQLDGDRLTVDGTVLQGDDIPAIITALEQINGIEQITNNIQIETQPISTRLYFDQNSAAVKPSDVDLKLSKVKEYLLQYPNINLRIMGYQHPTESATDVALKRAQSAQLLLQDQGIDRRRILALGVNQPPSDITTEDPIWLSRTVIFDIADSTPQD